MNQLISKLVPGTGGSTGGGSRVLLVLLYEICSRLIDLTYLLKFGIES